MTSIEKKIKETVIKYNLEKSFIQKEKNNIERAEYGYCLFTNPEYADKYFVISKVDVYRGDTLEDVKLNAYVFDKDGEEMEFDTSGINLNEVIKKGTKVCEIV
jgi:hypothetical protein